MKLIYLILIIAFTASCNSSNTRDSNVLEYEQASSPIMAGRGFVEAVLKGDFQVAKNYVAPTPDLERLMASELERPYNQLPPATQKALEQSSIRIDKVVGDKSLRTLYYGNNANDKQRKLNLILNGTEWKVIYDSATESPF